MKTTRTSVGFSGIQAMHAQDVVDELKKQPFQPVRVELTDGLSYEIRHPDLVIVFPSKVVIATPGRNQPQPAERYDVVSMSHIMRLTPLNASSTPATG